VVFVLFPLCAPICFFTCFVCTATEGQLNCSW
jgi:hypothetical protein